MAPAQGWHAQIEKCKQGFSMLLRDSIFYVTSRQQHDIGSMQPESQTWSDWKDCRGKTFSEQAFTTITKHTAWKDCYRKAIWILFRGLFVETGTIWKSSAWPLRKDDTRKSRSGNREVALKNSGGFYCEVLVVNECACRCEQIKEHRLNLSGS